MEMSNLYRQYIRDEIQISDMTQEQFNSFMFEHYAGYQSRGGTKNFKEFMKDCADYGL